MIRLLHFLYDRLCCRHELVRDREALGGGKHRLFTRCLKCPYQTKGIETGGFIYHTQG